MLLFLWNCHSSDSFSTKNEEKKLYYFTNADTTTVGVKDEAGNIIIPARKSAYVGYDFKRPITDDFIELYLTDKKMEVPEASPIMPMGEVYDRNGKFLYHPQFFDNGPDYWQDGVRRFVENGQIGFVDKSSKKIIKAKFDFADQFNYGYTIAYTGGWKKKYDAGGEHWSIVPVSANSKSFIINKKGEKVVGHSQAKNSKDYYYEGKYYPYPFQYSNFEQKVVDSLNNVDVLNDINLANCGNCTPKEDFKLQFEIIEYPDKRNPFYTLQGYQNQRIDDGFTFVVSANGANYYHIDWSGTEKVPLQRWINTQSEKMRK